jgi:hypothetical protein
MTAGHIGKVHNSENRHKNPRTGLPSPLDACAVVRLDRQQSGGACHEAEAVRQATRRFAIGGCAFQVTA